MSKSRLLSIDIVRGVVMILMALDHCRELLYVHSSADPMDLTTTSAPLFLTRWVTHLCAPGFVFLSGVSAFISCQKTGNGEFLIKRGLWLILLECTVINFGIWFDIHFRVLLLQVIAAIGVGLVVLGLLVKAKLKPFFALIIGILMICFYPFVPVNYIDVGITGKFIKHLFQPGLVPLSGEHMLLIGYPPVPWLGIILAGYGSGKLFLQSSADRKKHFLVIGGILLLVFIFLRTTALFGDPSKWSIQSSPLFTFFSFINVTKYPPSLQFDLLLLGIVFFMLYAAENLAGFFASVFATFGRVPLFYYIIHWYVIHFILFVVLFIQGFGIQDFSFGFHMGRPAGVASGLALGAVYVVWLAVVIALYPLCMRYGRFKQKWMHRKTWLRYL